MESHYADLIPHYYKEDLLKVATRGLQVSSRQVSGAGHMTMHTHPRGTAEAIVASLVHDTVRLRLAVKTGVIAKL
ncbi:uncharacterized protein PHACADRAFT_198400 [Phanerochaete carnosa HHB-10118-sp]|uniref:Uncharacterized protein n=1 Tax=Phanerochaete carnosa (strain HHB-10118-sp) TaxID=650164 RepID=K5UR62_PHACS|nr:uncharacterized protein PHACADRAFT_198400 [Phanerochaete carnosa HHB-10118-sp]EKM52336.1 hypothetical protein PHACADRAFT_198400 [Phanerochaete carnosa HHB-10118-sp]